MTPEQRLQRQLQELLTGSPFQPEPDAPSVATVEPPVEPPATPSAPQPSTGSPASLAQRLGPSRPAPEPAPKAFFPPAPTTPEQIGLSAPEIEALFLKFLMNRGLATGAEIAAQLCLPLGLIGGLLR